MGSTYERTAGDMKARGLAEQSGRVMEEVRELGHIAASSATDAVKDLREQSAEALKKGKQRLTGLSEDFGQSVSANPWKSVLIAAGVGALIGFVLRRSR
jgi:ElaB/YqjD/DUF883 family membrane-anchored ribosome-binding protein